MSTTIKKARYWGFILYPYGESTPKNWLDILINTRLKFVVSPLHDHDTWSEYDISKKEEYCKKNNIKKGSLKKEHYHVVICYPNTTTEKAMLGVLEELNIIHIEPISSVLGQYEYFTHKHNEDKFPYDEKDIKSYNGFNINDYYELTSLESLKIKTWIIDYIIENNINHYDDLVNQLMKFGCLDELNMVMNNTMFFNSYLKSKYNRICDQKKFTDINIKEKTKL